MPEIAAIVCDLGAELSELDEVVAGLADGDWDLPTPAEGWSIRDQIAHLAFFDEQATRAVEEPDAFAVALQEIAADVDGFMNDPLVRARAMAPADVLDWWRAARAAEVAAFDSLDGTDRIPWFGPPMSAASFVSARIMETWAHGQDIWDALGRDRAATSRLKHICHLGVRARPNSYSARGLTVPEDSVAVVLRGPDGDEWMWNEGAEQSITGDALDFCLVVTQRRHLADTALVSGGRAAREWLEIAQAFAGPPGSGRKPGQFAVSAS
ncbi:MAG: hypothetical protein QOF16_1279 [Actinomycetota bacterium]|nr:hypothetical protein [Actinomycetota bacterium]